MSTDLKQSISNELLPFNLSEQQLIIAKMILDGYSNADIAIALNVKVPTVKNYVTTVYKKTKTKDRHDLIATIYKEVIKKNISNLPGGLSWN